MRTVLWSPAVVVWHVNQAGDSCLLVLEGVGTRIDWKERKEQGNLCACTIVNKKGIYFLLHPSTWKLNRIALTKNVTLTFWCSACFWNPSSVSWLIGTQWYTNVELCAQCDRPHILYMSRCSEILLSQGVLLFNTEVCFFHFLVPY